MQSFSSEEDLHHSPRHVSQEIAKCIQIVSNELIATEERERHRLAMELHDYLAQLLVVTKMKLVESQKNADHSTKGKECVIQAEDMIDQALCYVRSLISDLYPKSLYEKGLPYALGLLIQRLREVGLQVTFQHEPYPDAFPQEHNAFFFRTIRELLFNVLKHAGVQEAHVYLGPGCHNNIEVRVEDNGKGFDPQTALQHDSGNEKFGLSEISKRAEALGTHFTLKSAPGQGTCITLSIPWKMEEC